jgi:hypothetical protein
LTLSEPAGSWSALEVEVPGELDDLDALGADHVLEDEHAGLVDLDVGGEVGGVGDGDGEAELVADDVGGDGGVVVAADVAGAEGLGRAGADALAAVGVAADALDAVAEDLLLLGAALVADLGDLALAGLGVGDADQVAGGARGGLARAVAGGVAGGASRWCRRWSG